MELRKSYIVSKEYLFTNKFGLKRAVRGGWHNCTMISKRVRTDPPGLEPNNQDVFIWALYLLGGADKDVDVEEIYVKCFELAPARLGWRTKPEIPDYKKTSKALQSVEATTHIGLIHRPHKYARRLTPDGINWIKSFENQLTQTYSGKPVAASASHNQYERVRRLIKDSIVWDSFINGKTEFYLPDVASALRCSPTSPQTTWDARINELNRASQVFGDEQLKEFASVINIFIKRKLGI